MNRNLLPILLLLIACGSPNPPPPGGNIQIDPIDATAIEFLQISNRSLSGNITVQGEVGRTLIEVVPDLSALTPEQLELVIITSEINPDFPEAASIFADTSDNSDAEINLLVLVPDSLLEIDVGGFSDVSVDNLEGIVTASSVRGDILLDNLQGEATISLDEGNITATNIFSPSVDITLAVGVIDLESFLPENGTISIDAAVGPGSSVTLRVPVNTGATLLASTEDIAIVTISPNLLFNGVNSGTQAQGTLAGGGTRDIQIFTIEGAIDIVGF